MARDDWRPVPVNFMLWQVARERGSKVFRAYERGELSVLTGYEPFLPGGAWHLSISCKDRDPTWEEQVAAVRDLLPDDREYASYIVPATEHINFHEHCFHWWETRSTPGERMARAVWV